MSSRNNENQSKKKITSESLEILQVLSRYFITSVTNFITCYMKLQKIPSTKLSYFSCLAFITNTPLCKQSLEIKKSDERHQSLQITSKSILHGEDFREGVTAFSAMITQKWSNQQIFVLEGISNSNTHPESAWVKSFLSTQQIQGHIFSRRVSHS